ncbi:hypothetical protein [Streptomyces sp. NPDC059371]|uniref:hypothetical protein n=1 Tax=Streptomyces sp. NPDC059371 TaxID=3346812 RepID=UPI0036CEDD54
MVRYVHHQLAAIVEAGVAMAVTAPVVFGVRGLPEAGIRKALPLVCILGAGALFGLPAVSMREQPLGKGQFL